PIGTDADHVGYDPATKYLYVGFGDSKSGGLAIIDTGSNKHIADIKTDARPVGSRLKNRRHKLTSRFPERPSLESLISRSASRLKPGRLESNRMSRSRSMRVIIDSSTAFVTLRSCLSSTQSRESKFPRRRASPESTICGMTLRTSVFMPRGAEGLKWGLYTSMTKKTQIITN